MDYSSQSYQVGSGKGANNSLSLHSLQGISNKAYANNNGNASLGQLSTGQVFQGTVVDIRNNQVSIQVDQQTVQAKFQDMVNICIGETLKFVIRENTGKQVTIAPYHEQIGNLSDGAIYKALDAAGLAATDKNIDIVNTLLEHGMAVDKQTITTFISASLRYPDVELSQFVDMARNNMPLTNTNIELWNVFLGEKSDFSSNLQQVIQVLSDTVGDAYMNGDYQAVEQLLDTIVTSNQTKNSDGLQLSSLLQEVESQTMLKTVREQLAEVVTKELTNSWGIKPEEFHAESLKQVSQRMEQQLEAFKDITIQNPATKDQLQQALQLASQNLEFTNQLNKQMEQAKSQNNAFDLLYAQIPLKLQGQLKHSDLYVYCNKKKASTSSKNMSLFLHLDMESLGDMDIMIKTQDYRINATFTLSDEEAYEIVREHLPELEDNLKEKGYFFTASASKKEAKEQGIQELFEEASNEGVLKRYSFDVRA
ncbi:flagellar hook-length control protein FliK [Anaerosporobacter sp.]